VGSEHSFLALGFKKQQKGRNTHETYSVNSDCSGKAKDGKGKNATPFTFAIANGGNRLYVMETDVANVSGTATKQ
jgi:hypothetical protein